MVLSNFTAYNQPYTATLEPRLFYVYVPHTNQDNLPNFDTIELPFFFDQLFALNAFQGPDRLENANQMSFSITSDIIRNTDGSTIFSASLGSIYYFTQPTVCLLSGCILDKRNISPIATALTFNPNNIWSISSEVAWDPYLNALNAANLSVGYHRDGRHVVNFSYSFVNANAQSLPTFNQIYVPVVSSYAGTSNFFSADYAWPLSMRWTTLAHADYDATNSRLNGAYAGIQYESCCWSIRFVINKLFSGAEINSNGTLKNSYDTGYFVELRLKGLTSFETESGIASDEGLVAGYEPTQEAQQAPTVQ